MGVVSKKRIVTGIFPVLLLFVIVSVSLYLLNASAVNLSKASTSVEETVSLFERMLLVNVVVLVTLIVLIGVNLFRLIRRYRRRVPGSKLTIRMFFMFVLLSVIPVTLVFYFSLQLINRDIDKPSTELIRDAGSMAKNLSNIALDLMQAGLVERTEKVARDLSNLGSLMLSLRLAELREDVYASEMTVRRGNSIVAFSAAEENKKPKDPSEHVLQALKKHGRYVSRESEGDSGFFIRVVVPIPRPNRPVISLEAEDLYLYASYPASKRVKRLADGIGKAIDEYRRRGYLRQYLKRNVILVLTLVLMLSLLTAVWAAFFSTRRLVAPITELAEGTRDVAEGRYDRIIPVTTHDELGFLVKSFNYMTRQLAVTSLAAKRGQQLVEEQRAYLQAVLANLSSGVITLDQDHLVKVINAQSSQILDADLNQYLDQPLSSLSLNHPHLQTFVSAMNRQLDSEAIEWREEVTLFSKSGRQVLLVRGTKLQDEEGVHSGHIIVFDDVTQLLKAQRDAAWGEVARRMAHEIKNPLTPIQLSADRLRRRYLKTLSKEDAQLLDRSTNTIIQQVETLKSLVNAFSEYARAPKIRLSSFDLNELIREVLDFQTGGNPQLKLELRLDPQLPELEADMDRIRQLLNNVILNAIEAMEGKSRQQLDITTRYVRDKVGHIIELVIRDYGEGFPEDEKGEHFEPYFTTKPRGTGLGLAIVKRIVEEHSGIVWLENASPQGAKIVIHLPVTYDDNTEAGESRTEPTVEG